MTYNTTNSYLHRNCLLFRDIVLLVAEMFCGFWVVGNSWHCASNRGRPAGLCKDKMNEAGWVASLPLPPSSAMAARSPGYHCAYTSGVVIHAELMGVGPLPELLDLLILQGNPIADEIFGKDSPSQQIVLVAIEGLQGSVE